MFEALKTISSIIQKVKMKTDEWDEKENIFMSLTG